MRRHPLGTVLLVAAVVSLVTVPAALAGHGPLNNASRLVGPYFKTNATTETLVQVNAFFGGDLPQNLDLRFHNPACSVNVNRNASVGLATSDRGSAIFVVGGFGAGISEGWFDIQQTGGATPNRLAGAVTIIDFDGDVFLNYDLIPLPNGNEALLPTDIVAGPVLGVAPPVLTGTLVLVSVGAFAANGGGDRTVNFRINDPNGDFTTGNVGPFNCQFIGLVDTVFPGTHKDLLPAPPAGNLFYPYFRVQALTPGPTVAIYFETYDDGTFHWGQAYNFWE